MSDGKSNEPQAPGPSTSPEEIDPRRLVTQDPNTRERIRRPGAWTAVPNLVLTDRRLRPCSSTARHLFAVGWIFANAGRTDGAINDNDLRSLAAAMNVTEAQAHAAAAELVKVGLWATGYLVIDFTAWNLSAEEIARRAEESRQRAQRWRDGKKVFPAPFSKKEEEDRSQQKSTGTYDVRTAYGAGKPDNGNGIPLPYESQVTLSYLLAEKERCHKEGVEFPPRMEDELQDLLRSRSLPNLRTRA